MHTLVRAATVVTSSNHSTYKALENLTTPAQYMPYMPHIVLRYIDSRYTRSKAIHDP